VCTLGASLSGGERAGLFSFGCIDHDIVFLLLQMGMCHVTKTSKAEVGSEGAHDE
jgi:hypothetical protein